MCTGYGGLDLAVMEVYGTRLAWCADNDPHVSKILDERFPLVTNLGDLTAVDWTTIPRADIVTAGFPCTDISYAGRGAGLREDTRSGLWFTIVKALRILRPDLVFVENVPALRSRGLDRVLGDLASLGYDTAWTSLRASDIGVPHRRERIFILAAHPDGQRPPRRHEPRSPQGSRPHPQPAGRGLRIPPADTSGLQSERWRDPEVLAEPPGTPAASTSPSARDRHQAPQFSDPRTDGCRRAILLDPAGQQADFGAYKPAIRYWEAVSGRPAPYPTEIGTRGQSRLSARFVEWMMGLPDGWVTGVDLSRTAHMRALGNGVVPQQAAAALEHLADLLGEDRS